MFFFFFFFFQAEDGIRDRDVTGVQTVCSSDLYYLHFAQYLNTFRGEPAITKFDWPFTPNHKSSQAFATATSSVLPYVFTYFQLAHD